MLVLDTGVSLDVAPGGAPLSASGALAKKRLANVLGDGDPWDHDADLTLDPVAGHGTFIAGLITNLAPGATVTVDRSLASFGDTDDALIAQSLMDRFGNDAQPRFDLVSMSLGGFVEEDDPPMAIATAIARIQARFEGSGTPPNATRERVVFVASAGNDASCRPTWPASFEGVIAVGALGPDGPASFTNYGPWVDACAPGVDAVSTFFDLTGVAACHDGEDFAGWSTWSGTSFAAPVVTASIAWEWMNRTDPTVTPGDAAAWLLDRPGHYRYPGLGTVVNTH